MPNDFDVKFASGEEALISHDGRLVDLIDGLLATGVVIRGEATISVADVDLVFLGVDLILADPDVMGVKQ